MREPGLRHPGVDSRSDSSSGSTRSGNARTRQSLSGFGLLNPLAAEQRRPLLTRRSGPRAGVVAANTGATVTAIPRSCGVTLA